MPPRTSSGRLSLDGQSQLTSGEQPIYVVKEEGQPYSMTDRSHLSSVSAYADRPMHAKHELKRLRETDFKSYMKSRFDEHYTVHRDVGNP